jgi:hypothetical protein
MMFGGDVMSGQVNPIQGMFNSVMGKANTEWAKAVGAKQSSLITSKPDDKDAEPLVGIGRSDPRYKSLLGA